MAKTNKYIRDTINQIEDMKKKKWQLKLLVTPRKMTAKLGEFSAAVSQSSSSKSPSLLTWPTPRSISTAIASNSKITCPAYRPN
jgi:hypothetical protein